jgi:alkylated DNA repair dioxygenase AlkB
MSEVLEKPPVTYLPNFLTPILAQEVFELLRDELDWERRESAPRSEYWTNTFGRDYTYGRGAGVRTYQARKTHPEINFVRGLIHLREKVVLEGCFLNYYLDGSDSLGWHADDDPAIDHSKPIAVVTLGTGRDIAIKAQEKGAHPQRFFLEPGSLLLMHPGMQQTHYHSIPKADVATGPRISMTYRGLVAKPPSEGDPRD